ncbi:MAG: PD40 domain-containing protein [Deltaproteobacteria bacterium]|nr:PD40 domain-containing protein [Deltaproteobacteria bacterium]
MKRLVLALLLAASGPAAAQPLLPAPPDVGQALREMDRQRARRQGLEQNYVLPERPGQNQVSWYDFEWQHFDVPSPSGGKGGIRLYFYRRERAIAERALPAIRATFLKLVEQFHYSPTKQIPYFLYSSQREFQTTNIFQVGESVLGVTSPRDLKMSLPYFGDHEKFREVSTHEMVHQFTIQKLLDIAGADQLDFLDNLPLWFIEGIAEYYTKDGLDAETDMYLRDLVWNPDPERGYMMIPFVEDRARGYIPTYKIGQARVAFIAETYGGEKVQELLESAYAPSATAGQSGGGRQRGGFAALVRRVLNDPPEQVEIRWRAWLKRRYFPDYLRARQDLPQVRDYSDLPGEAEHYAASPDGWLVAYRALDRERGRAHIYLFDVRHPKGAVHVVGDNQPGVESLHPVETSILALSGDELVFTAQAADADALYVVPFTHTPPREGKAPRISLGSRRRVEVRAPSGQRFVELGSPALSPDGKQIAFVALTEQGQRDVYVVPGTGGVARQLTRDDYAERDLSWGAAGLAFASDATEHGKTNLFLLDPASGAVTRLTTAPTADRYPSVQADGSILFSSDAGGRTDIHRLTDGRIARLTDFSTGLASPAAAPLGRGLFAGTFHRGRFRLVEVPRVAWLEDPPQAVAPAVRPVQEPAREPIPEEAPPYQPYSWQNWRPENGMIFGGGGGNAVAGRAALLLADVLRDRSLYLDVAVLGSFDYTQALVLYEDRQSRTGLVLGAFHFVNQQVDRFNDSLAFFQRDFGLLGGLRFPLDRFRRFELELQAGASERYCLTDFSVSLPVACSGRVLAPPSTTQAWRRDNGSITPSTVATARFGYDTVRLDPYTGPIDGGSLVLELGGGWLPWRNAAHGFARLDAARWVPLVGRSNLMFRAAAGGSFAPDRNGYGWARSWWLTSADNLRGFSPFDTSFLIGPYYYVANAELQFPLDYLVRLFFFDYLEGVAALDFGGVATQWKDVRQPDGTTRGLWQARTLTGVLGVNALLGPLLLRVHFGYPWDIGGQKTPALEGTHRWVTNVTLRWAFF